MPLEAGDGFISGLVSTNPVNATDQVAQGDDHLRLLKVAVKGTFPNLNGAVTASPAELNILDGALLSTAELNILDGATLSTAELNILDGVTLTAAQINEAARLSQSNTFTGAVQTVNVANATWKVTDGALDGRFIALSGSSVVQAGAFSNHPFELFTNGTVRLSIGAAGDFDFKGGTVTTNGASAAEVGYQGTPPNTQDTNYTLVLTDRGKTIYKSAGGAGETITIPANGSVAFPVGTQLDIVNNGGGDLTIAITTDTLSWAVDGSIGSRTLADHGWAVLKKVAATEWFVTGTGLS